MNEPSTTDPRVRAYLDAVRRSLSGADPVHADAIVADLEAHVAEAVDDEASAGRPADVDAILRALGEPDAIAAAARGPEAASTRDAPRPRGFLDTRGGGILTVVVLTIGGAIVPVLGWVAGLILLWNSHCWRVRDKLVATFATPVVLFVSLVAVWLFRVAERSTADCGPGCLDSPLIPAPFDVLWTVVLTAVVVMPVVVAIWLLATLREPAPEA